MTWRFPGRAVYIERRQTHVLNKPTVSRFRRPALAVCVLAGATLGLPLPARAATPERPAFASPFGCGQTWYASTYRGHEPNAVDWNLAPGSEDYGQPVLASAPGTATVLKERGYGTYVVVDHGAGWQSLFAHLSSVNVRSGASVRADTVVGRVGRSGHADGSHLHHEQRLNAVTQPVIVDGTSVNASTGTRGAAYRSLNCGVQRATVEWFADPERTRRVDANDVPPAALLFVRITAPPGFTPRDPEIVAAGASEFAAPAWTSPTTPAFRRAERGGSWTADFVVRSPNREGAISEGFSVASDLGFTLAAVLRHHLRWGPAEVRYTLDRQGHVAAPQKLLPGQVVWAWITARNTSTFAWDSAAPVDVTTSDGRPSIFRHTDWDEPSRPGGPTGDVGVGEEATFVFRIVAPASSGDYAGSFAPVSVDRRGESHPAGMRVVVRDVPFQPYSPAPLFKAGTNTSSSLF